MVHMYQSHCIGVAVLVGVQRLYGPGILGVPALYHSEVREKGYMRVCARAGAILSIAAGLLLSGCRTQVDSVAVIPRTTSTLLWEPLHMGVAEQARGTGIDVYWNAPADEGDSEKQLALFAAVQRRAYRGIIFAPSETLNSRSAVLQAVARRVPVVIVDDELGPPAGPYLSYVTNDEVAGARLAAERVKTLLHGHGSIALMGISPRIESGLTREEVFEHVLAEIDPGVEIKVRHFGDLVTTHQQQIAQEILDGREHVDAIVALTSAATRGAYYARIAMEPRPAIAIVGFDQDLLAPLQLGEVDSVVVQDTRRIGQLAMQNMQAQLAGRAAPQLTRVAPLLLTRENLNSEPVRGLWSFADYDWSSK